MNGKKIALLVCGWIIASSCQTVDAQDWAAKMFKVREKDFGTVTKNSDVKYRFVIQNIYEEDVHIYSVSSSCGCATPTIEKKDIKTWEETAILAKFNTNSFTGKKSATITVRIDKPYRAEVQLKVSGNIQGNLTFEPDQIDFGEIKQFTKSIQKIRITSKGSRNWSIADVKSNYEHVKVFLSKPYRGQGTVIYDMVVEVQETAPKGFLQNELIVFTTEAYGRSQVNENQVPVTFSGKVSPALQVVPDVARIGPIEIGGSGKRKIIVKGDMAFKILDVECDNSNFSVSATGDSKKLHALTVTYTGAEKSGEVKEVLKIVTDVANAEPIEVPAVVTISEPEGE